MNWKSQRSRVTSYLHSPQRAGCKKYSGNMSGCDSVVSFREEGREPTRGWSWFGKNKTELELPDGVFLEVVSL